MEDTETLFSHSIRFFDSNTGPPTVIFFYPISCGPFPCTISFSIASYSLNLIFHIFFTHLYHLIPRSSISPLNASPISIPSYPISLSFFPLVFSVCERRLFKRILRVEIESSLDVFWFVSLYSGQFSWLNFRRRE